MYFKGLVRTLCVLAAIPIASSHANAVSYGALNKSSSLPSGSAMREAGNTLSPFAHTKFCIANPGECRPRNNHKGDRITLSPRNWSILREVNNSVNRSIKPRRDRGDRWSVNIRAGDCEDYALTKRRRLISKGFSSSALVIATGTLPGGRHHAVLMVKTDRGDYVLDNLRNSVVSWNRVPYRWQKRQSSRNPRQWVSLSGRAVNLAKQRQHNRRHIADGRRPAKRYQLRSARNRQVRNVRRRNTTKLSWIMLNRVRQDYR